MLGYTLQTLARISLVNHLTDRPPCPPLHSSTAPPPQHPLPDLPCIIVGFTTGREPGVSTDDAVRTRVDGCICVITYLRLMYILTRSSNLCEPLSPRVTHTRRVVRGPREIAEGLPALNLGPRETGNSELAQSRRYMHVDRRQVDDV